MLTPAFIEKWGGVCAYCDKPVVNRSVAVGQPVPWDTATKDHVIPKSRGGIGKPDGSNLALFCYRCNSQKGNLDVEKLVRIWYQADPKAIRKLVDDLRKAAHEKSVALAQAKKAEKQRAHQERVAEQARAKELKMTQQLLAAIEKAPG